MLLIIGLQDCSNCNMTKSILDKKEIKYTYKLASEIPKKELRKYIEKARIQGMMNFPLIIKNDKIIILEDVVK